MGNVLRITLGIAVVLGFAACGSDGDTATNSDTPTSTDTVNAMPDVMGLQLDVALSDIERAGFEDEVEILGGGTFGVVNESNWQVCDQLPAAGEAMTDVPRLTVDRSCPDVAAEPEVETPEVTEPEPVDTEAAACSHRSRNRRVDDATCRGNRT